MAFRISLIIIGIVCTLYYVTIVPGRCGDYCTDTHQQIIDNEFTSPWNYRILLPFTAEYLIRYGIAEGVYSAYAVIHVVLIPITLLALYEWLRLQISPERAFGACVMFGFFLPFIFITNYGIGAWSTAEVFFLCISFILLQRIMSQYLRFILIAIITIIASLNRETAIFIPVAYFLANIDLKNTFDKRLWLEAIVLAGFCFGTVFLVRWVRGPADPMVPFADGISINMSFAKTSLIFNCLLLPLWLPVISRRRYISPFIKRLMWLFPLYALAFLLFGIWSEIRLWMPMFPLALAIIFSNGTDRLTMSPDA
jgi:hypothetical protein